MEKLLGGLSLSHKPILFLFELKTSLKTPKLLTQIKMYRKFYDQINEKKKWIKNQRLFSLTNWVEIRRSKLYPALLPNLNTTTNNCLYLDMNEMQFLITYIYIDNMPPSLKHSLFFVCRSSLSLFHDFHIRFHLSFC